MSRIQADIEKPNILIVLSGPSGAGKSTICQEYVSPGQGGSAEELYRAHRTLLGKSLPDNVALGLDGLGREAALQRRRLPNMSTTSQTLSCSNVQSKYSALALFVDRRC